MLDRDRFRFLNVERLCAGRNDWTDVGIAKLWRYNLHYFDDLNAFAAERRVAWHEALLARWILENPPASGDGWEPYPTSRRIVNWIKWSLRGHPLDSTCLQNLATQARWLSRRLEFHILGNHLFANAKALLFAGLFFEGDEADSWLARGLELIDHEIEEQVLVDGAHFELSPMYHAAIVEDLLDLINILRAYGCCEKPSWQDKVCAMLRWLKVMTHPDGKLVFFNDAAFSIAPALQELDAYAARLGVEGSIDPKDPVTTMSASGYVRALTRDAYLICDCAAIGPDYLPGHAHADTLSFELSLRGRRIFVNSGTSEYGVGPERQRQRGSAAHNTVVVDGADSSEVWAGFRVARRARAKLVTARLDSESDARTIVAWHDGYSRLAGKVSHRRSWNLHRGRLLIEDYLEGRFTSAIAYYHLHPEIAVAQLSAYELELSPTSMGALRVSFESAAEVKVVKTTWHPEFGLAVPNLCIQARFRSSILAARVEWDESP